MRCIRRPIQGPFHLMLKLWSLQGGGAPNAVLAKNLTLPIVNSRRTWKTFASDAMTLENNRLVTIRAELHCNSVTQLLKADFTSFFLVILGFKSIGREAENSKVLINYLERYIHGTRQLSVAETSVFIYQKDPSLKLSLTEHIPNIRLATVVLKSFHLHTGLKLINTRIYC